MRKHFFLLMRTLAFTGVLFQTAIAQNTTPYWSAAGNSNATTSSKLGTTNGIHLRLYTNNAERVRITTSGNVGIGTTAPMQRLDVTGNINLGKGYGLYMENRRVLRVDSVLKTAFLGNGAGSKNVADFNTGVGYNALNLNNYGQFNTAIGASALNYNLTGDGNVAVGVDGLRENTSGSLNTAIGNSALSLNTEGNENVALGIYALSLNKTGSYNTAAGSGALYGNSAGRYNIAFGKNALRVNYGGNENVAIGSHALDATYDASSNTAVGHLAGNYWVNGWNNTFIGSYARANAHGIFNSIALGNGAIVTAPNQVRIGNNYVTSIGGYANWTVVSDGRVKRNIQENVPGLAFINKLKPVTYSLDLDAADKINGAGTAKDKDGKQLIKTLTQQDIAARQAKQQVVYTGFIAQDVEKAAKELKYDFSGVDAAKSEQDLYGLRYTEFVMPLVKAVQELSQKDEELQQKTAEIDALKKDIAELRRMVQALTKGTMREVASPSATLGQNTPNPTTSSTRISFTLPKTNGHAQLLLIDASGKTVRTIPLTSSGAININTTDLSSGVYNYSLMVDNKIVETKRLTIAH